MEFRIEGEPRPCHPGLDLTTYRVIQEALTNVIKHAGPATVMIRMHFRAGWLDLEITNSGVGPAPEDLGRTEPGHGLIGMRERRLLVVSYGRAPLTTVELSVRAKCRWRHDLARRPFTGRPRADASPGVVPAREFDLSFAVGAALILEIEAFTSDHRRGPLAVNVVAVAVMTLAAHLASSCSVGISRGGLARRRASFMPASRRHQPSTRP